MITHPEEPEEQKGPVKARVIVPFHYSDDTTTPRAPSRAQMELRKVVAKALSMSPPVDENVTLKHMMIVKEHRWKEGSTWRTNEQERGNVSPPKVDKGKGKEGTTLVVS